MTLAIISHRDCLLHEVPLGHPEKPDRVAVIQQALKEFPFKCPVKFIEAPLVTQTQLFAVHGPNYVNWIFSIAPKEESIAIDEDTWMSPHTLKAARRAAGAVVAAVDLVMAKKVKAAFCNVRPPGHHAEKEVAMGFCFFNNVAIGVMHAIKKYGIKRIAIIDFDVHHGNGTQNIFQSNEEVLYCSSFQYPFYPGYEEESDNAHILSIPLPAGTSGPAFRKNVTPWFKKLLAFQPEFIFFSAGFDAHADDPLAQLNLHKEDFVWLTERIAKIAASCCKGRIVSVLEGGYNLEALAECVPAHVAALIY